MKVPVPDHLIWPVWRIFIDKGISPYEIETCWTLGMVLDANDALDLKEEAEYLSYEASKEK